MQPHWVVLLDDGTEIGYGQGTIFADLPMDRVRELHVYFNTHAHRVLLSPDTRPIYYVNHELELNPNNGDLAHRWVVVVGWQKTVRGVNVKSLTYITMDGRVIHTDDDWHGWKE